MEQIIAKPAHARNAGAVPPAAVRKAKGRPAAPEGGDVDAAGKDRQFVTALARGLQVLSCFSAETPELSGAQLAKMTGLPQPTVWRLCHTMLELGMLTLTGNDRMRPGLAVLRLGHSALAKLDAVELARPHMQEIADQFRAACGFAQRHDLRMVMLERCHGDNQLLTNLRRGSIVHIANSGLGWACLAGVSEQERRDLVADMERSDAERWNASRKQFLAAFAEYEKHGFIVNAGVFHPDYHTAAVPVYDRHGRFAYGLNCGGPVSTLPPAVLRNEVAPRLIALAGMLGSVLD